MRNIVLHSLKYPILAFEQRESTGVFTIRFSGKGEACEFSIDPAKARAQWRSAECPAQIPTFCEQMTPEMQKFWEPQHSAYHARNYAKENLCGIDAPFTLRIQIHADPKLNAALIDVEISGCHTMATMRNDLAVCCAEASVPGILRFAPIK